MGTSCLFSAVLYLNWRSVFLLKVSGLWLESVLQWRRASGLSLSQPQALSSDTDVSVGLGFSSSDDFIIVKCSWTRRSGSRLQELQIICCWLIIKHKTHQIYMSAEKSPTSIPFSLITEVLKMSLYITTLWTLSVIHVTSQESQVLMLSLVFPMCRL